MGARLAAGLRGLGQRHGCIGDVRGRGLLLGLEFAGAEAGRVSDAVTSVAMDLGLSANIVSTGGTGGIMRIAPPLTVSEAEIDLGVELLDAAIARVMG
jgi:2,2-dialkylglycine decarboxylase (pyruvate)